MSELKTLDPDVEPERYELQSASMYRFGMNRRELMKSLGGGILVLLTFNDALAIEIQKEKETRGAAQQSGESGRRARGDDAPQEISAWLHIDERGKVTVFTGKVEVGQNIRTSLAQAVGEEMRVPISAIHMVMADTDLTPFDRGTFGSRTTPTMNPQLRRAAAAAREILITLAMERYDLERSKLDLRHGHLYFNVGDEPRVVSYGELLRGQEFTQTIGDDPSLTETKEWSVMGQPVPKTTGVETVRGKHHYTSDMKLPGMLHGKVLRPTKLNSDLVSLDSKAAEAIPGVTVVREGNLVGVTAPDASTATRAMEVLKAEWKAPAQVSDADLFKHLRSTAEAPGEDERIQAQLEKADHSLSHTYTIAYIAHAPLEPRAAVAQWADGKLTVWTGTQRPFGVRDELAEAFKVPVEKVRVIVPDTGSGYGGKHTGDAALEAARLAKAAKKPVKLTWSRPEEFHWAYFRPAGVIDVRSGVDKDGKLIAWDFHNYNSGGSGLQTPYEVAAKREGFHNSQSPLRQGSYRGLAGTANHFARETQMDEHARYLKIDPLEFRLVNLKDNRLRAVLEAAAKGFGWGNSKPEKGHGFGIAGGTEKGGYVATCAEVTVDSSGQVKVVRAVTAFECGAVVNPSGLRNQIEGAMMMGIGGALFEAIEFEDGVITNARFSGYRVPRFSDMPKMTAILVDRKDLPSAGAGETPIMAIAPAIGNAIFDATGIRLHSLPMAPKGVTADRT